MNIREVSSLELLKVIVHVIDKQQSKPFFSQNDIELENMDEEVTSFIMNHIVASIDNNESKVAKFINKNTDVQNYANRIIKDAENQFVRSSQLIAQSLYKATPNNATTGCIVIVLYKETTSTEEFLALIKLDKNDAIFYEQNIISGNYELVYKGSTLPSPSKRNKLLKFATLRNTETITDNQLDEKPSLVILDKQVKDFSRFFYQTFLSAEFLLTDEHKSEILLDGVKSFLKNSIDYKPSEQKSVLNAFIRKLENEEQFTVEEAAEQIFSLQLQLTPELIQNEVQRLEQALRYEGMKELNLTGVITAKIKREYLDTQKIRTMEKIYVKYPTQFDGTKVHLNDSEEGDGIDIIINNVHIIND
ncbi:nucleoid-associated protein [Paenibacillus nuruki]|nr:nucleoid-associated protein [Paenibacillus nuruki]